MYPIVRKEILSASVKLFDLKAPLVAAKAKAGQFFILRADEKGERIPLTIADFDREQGTITAIFQEIGAGTRLLGQLEVGDAVLDVVGPLGVPSEIERFDGPVVVVGGGVGIAPIYPIARALKEAGNRVISIIGARNRELLFWEDKMAAVSDALIVCTDDGSYGRKGFVTDALKEFYEANGDLQRVWAIGPMPMMRAIANTTRPMGVHTIVSMNPLMMDGTGMCGACRVLVGGETKFACVDGPEFDGHLVDFDLALKRLAIYRDEEKRALAALEHHHEGGRCGCH
ncbi:sulfide/dihydroorotate dehydrogenase-like FAD/NAD-binding protein [Heliobacterium gestii]|uniref:Sulfide/dihydroorotate dehydrogenase-like FAD/NAD-binding protein n=1 Tax=Heliomicrobium gestii TaxID=2699 RepID=A0A845L9D1_HELGE|nr:sulfide/dihydroorotate dehydrogenase-like FAD/NAD-binding protein [Heliomicrobium gestii]MBM7867937.1 ferredoxin--NADP+ reductase [Heliomicrobium gestii]MZP43252.1 sulfide/dihydroorotate dehydrogenase-like FAD/NAD-binding protein [Heliomicrobium gestii]